LIRVLLENKFLSLLSHDFVFQLLYIIWSTIMSDELAHLDGGAITLQLLP